MSYLMLALLSVFMLFTAGALQRDNVIDAQKQQTVSLQSQATGTLHYMNALNSYLYYNPVADGTLSDSLLSSSPPAGVRHLIRQSRVFVYQPYRQGLIDALATHARQSALLGTVKSRRLIDLRGTDMQITVPDSIPDGSLVYLN